MRAERLHADAPPQVEGRAASPAEQGVLAGRVARHVRRPAEGRGAGHEEDLSPGARLEARQESLGQLARRMEVDLHQPPGVGVVGGRGAHGRRLDDARVLDGPVQARAVGEDPSRDLGSGSGLPEVGRHGAGLPTGLAQPRRGSLQALLAATQEPDPRPERAQGVAQREADAAAGTGEEDAGSRHAPSLAGARGPYHARAMRPDLPPTHWPTAAEAARGQLLTPLRVGSFESRTRGWVPAMVPCAPPRRAS